MVSREEGNLLHRGYMSYSLNSLKGGYKGDYIGGIIGVIKGDTRSLDYSSYEDYIPLLPADHQ